MRAEDVEVSYDEQHPVTRDGSRIVEGRFPVAQGSSKITRIHVGRGLDDCIRREVGPFAPGNRGADKASVRAQVIRGGWLGSCELTFSDQEGFSIMRCMDKHRRCRGHRIGR